MKLSIVVITMNRADQLRDALQSCVNSKLPDDTEFVIVDNASSDNTREIVKKFFEENSYPYKYEYEEKNLGVGGGRNRAFCLAEGEYAYFLDDDAVINPEDYDSFFKKPIDFFEEYPDVATITTTIIDRAWEKNRMPILARKWKRGGHNCIFMFFGGSHFLRCSVFREKHSLYENIMYGYEELSTSIYAMDKGCVHVFMPEISMIHCPKFNKWKKKDLLLMMNKGVCCTQYVIKSQLYPRYLKPLLWIAFKRRWKIYVGSESPSEDLAKMKLLKIHDNPISLSTFCNLIIQFGLSAL